MNTRTLRPWLIALAIAVVAGALMLTGHAPFQAEHLGYLIAPAAVVDVEPIMKALDGIEAKLKGFSEKAEGELVTLGKVSSDTKSAIDKLGTDQREMADRLVVLEQKGKLAPDDGAKNDDAWGGQFTKTDQFKAFAGGSVQKARAEVKNTVTNAVGNTFSDRKPGIVAGPFRPLRLEGLFNKLPTTSNAVDYVRENVFTNAAAETAEGASKPESSITTTLVTEPVATIAHWIKISRQLAMDNAALAAYINTRMRYGVDLRFENQLINGNGTTPNMSGLLKAGNFTAHGYTAANLTTRFGSGYTRLDLLRAIIADCLVNDYPADGILLNPVDWATIETLKDSQGRYIIGNPNDGSEPLVWRKPVIETNALGADQVIVASFAMAGTIYEREGVVVELSESDSDNFTKNLVTIRAERRAMLAVERPASVRAGDLTPA
ncbi:MAG: phage major capsid protein [Rubrivivax sp.]|nr:MAG: phage major capsid protein [Rubrivivax sp.]